MRNNNIERTILKTVRAGLEEVEELTEELRNKEAEDRRNKIDHRRRIDFIKEVCHE